MAADRRLAAHAAWWKSFWATSSVTMPDGRLQRHYDLVKYFYGAASRVGAPPMPLQGVWTADNGKLPPWKGDYHNDLNTQTTYIAYQAAGLFEAGESFLRYMSGLLPEFRAFATSFYGVDGAVVRFNTFEQPGRWVLRILQENRAAGFAAMGAIGEFTPLGQFGDPPCVDVESDDGRTGAGKGGGDGQSDIAEPDYGDTPLHLDRSIPLAGQASMPARRSSFLYDANSLREGDLGV